MNRSKSSLRVLVSVLRLVARAFFHPKYLRGQWFDQRMGGWVWTYRAIVTQKLFGFGRRVPWPVSPFVHIIKPENITFDPDDLNNFQTFGCYWQAQAPIVIGKGTYIGPNVGLLTSNHDPLDLSHSLPGKAIHIGQRCWIGMNAVILPGVTLGDGTVVGAGAVVTKSFPDGDCTLAGVPARVIKTGSPTGNGQTAVE